MKPKYEIGQTVYVKPTMVSYKVLGIMQLESGGYQYCLSYSQYWENEKKLTDNNKKYYILYRSADGLEKRETISHHLVSGPIYRPLKCPEPGCTLGKGERKYQFVETIADLDVHVITETYIYNEVI